VVDYRTFRNDDPPRLADLWNEVFCNRGAVRLRNASPLERFIFGKPYFDPEGLILAWDNAALVGFAHAGFGGNASESALEYADGVICAVGVRPTHRRRRIGSELVRRCEAYLTAKGARDLYAGPVHPLNPFYLGLYGGSELPGFLTSDADADPFFTKIGYRPVDSCLVLQRPLHETITVADARFPDLRRQYEVRVEPWSGPATWWQECVRGPLEYIGFHLEDKASGQAVARAEVWEMEGFTWRWNQPAAGIVGVHVREDLRRRGLARFLLTQVLRHMQEQYFGIAEAQTMQGNRAAIGLYHHLGFSPVDVGNVYRRAKAESDR
jgi:ribosomal protein S18 acetylase RimI-like enzyme